MQIHNPTPKFSSYVGIHKGKKFVVVGCGESAGLGKGLPKDIITIGVNDIGRLFWPNYITVIDNPNLFRERRKYVDSNESTAVFTYLSSWNTKNSKGPNTVLFQMGDRSLSNIDHHNIIDYQSNSPYVAAILAFKMGAKEIGFLGNDFQPNHFYEKDGVHNLIKYNRKGTLISAYKTLVEQFSKRGVRVWNLSGLGTIGIPEKALENFIKENEEC